MQINWPNDRCIVCLCAPRAGDEMSRRSLAHVIPKSIGGVLEVPFLCKRCNSQMGIAEAMLAIDPQVRVDVKNQRLQTRLPRKLVDAMLAGEGYFVDHPEYGRITAVVDKDGFLQPRQSAQIKDDENTLAQALAELDRIGEPERKDELREQFEQAGRGEWIELRPGYRIERLIDWTDVKFAPAWKERPVGHEVPLGIAYLHLALCLGERVYEEPALGPVREALRRSIDGDHSAARELLPGDRRMGTDMLEPMHTLRTKTVEGGTQVVFQVFRDLSWPVDFPAVELGGEQTLYVLDLEHGSENWRSKAA